MAEVDAADCETCKGRGTIRAGNIDCPDCGGKGKAEATEATEADLKIAAARTCGAAG